MEEEEEDAAMAASSASHNLLPSHAFLPTVACNPNSIQGPAASTDQNIMRFTAVVV